VRRMKRVRIVLSVRLTVSRLAHEVEGSSSVLLLRHNVTRGSLFHHCTTSVITFPRNPLRCNIPS
jgi:hypothetical protein